MQLDIVNLMDFWTMQGCLMLEGILIMEEGTIGLTRKTMRISIRIL